MFKIANEQELLNCFRELDRPTVELPSAATFPLFVRDYFAWGESSGVRTYVVFADHDPHKPLGIAFRRDSSHSSVASMCDWCHSIRSGENVGLLTATANSRKRVGLNLCRDLSCKNRIEDSPSASDFSESLTAHARVQRVIARMGEFARRQLF